MDLTIYDTDVLAAVIVRYCNPAKGCEAIDAKLLAAVYIDLVSVRTNVAKAVEEALAVFLTPLTTLVAAEDTLDKALL